MKILYYANHQIREGEGPSNHIVQVCNELAHRGNKVLLFTYRTNWRFAKYGLKVVGVPMPGRHRFKILRRIYRILWRHLANTIMMLFRPNVLYQREHLNDWVPLLLSLRWKVPLVIEVNGWYPMDIAEKKAEKEGPEVYWKVYWEVIELLRPSYEHAAAIITSSPGLRELILATYRIPHDHVIYISNGVDLERFRSVKPYCPRNEGKLVLGMISGQYPHIDFKSVLEAVSILASKGLPVELRLYLYGKNENIKTIIQMMNLEEVVKVFPSVPYSQVADVLSQIDICLAIYKKICLEKHKSIEAAMKLWDYWASQRPVIATDLPWTYSYKHHLEKRLLAVPPEDPQSLAQAIETLYRSPDLARTIAINGYRYVQSGHSWTDVAARIETVLKKVVVNQ